MSRHRFLSAACLITSLALSSAAWPAGPADPPAPNGPAAPAAQSEHPPIFDTRSYADAKAAAIAEKKWFIVKATATWCGPCKQMDRTTWRDEKVVAWCKEHAIVVALDVDREKAIATELRIEAMPTMVAFKEGAAEFDRIVGMRRAEEFLAWLTGIERGQTFVDGLAGGAGTNGKDGEKVDVRARMDLAAALASKGEFAKAADEYVWLWQHMVEHEPASAAVRVSFLVGDMGKLAAKNADVRKRFVALRDEARARTAGGHSWEDATDFLALNGALGDEEATIAWLDEAMKDPAWTPSLRTLLFRLRDPLVKRGRWADLGSLLGDAADALVQSWKVRVEMTAKLPGLEPQAVKDMVSASIAGIRVDVARDYAALLAAKRDADAARLAAKAVELDASAAMYTSLVDAAILAGVPRPAQAELLAGAIAKFPELAETRKRLDEALSARSK